MTSGDQNSMPIQCLRTTLFRCPIITSKYLDIWLILGYVGTVSDQNPTADRYHSGNVHTA